MQLFSNERCRCVEIGESFYIKVEGIRLGRTEIIVRNLVTECEFLLEEISWDIHTHINMYSDSDFITDQKEKAIEPFLKADFEQIIKLLGNNNITMFRWECKNINLTLDYDAFIRLYGHKFNENQ